MNALQLSLPSLSFENQVFIDFTPKKFQKIQEGANIYECENFLSSHKCQEIIQKARPLLVETQVFSLDAGKEMTSNTRTSKGAFIPTELEGDALSEARIQAEAETKIPQSHGELFQVLNYQEGGCFKPHFDCFAALGEKGKHFLENGGDRVATMIIYLNTPKEGGETEFPNANIKISPKEGKAVLFYNLDKEGNLDPLSRHAGAPVISGEKWIATLWIREREYFFG
jgi:prolyl 4-hydroxylase